MILLRYHNAKAAEDCSERQDEQSDSEGNLENNTDHEDLKMGGTEEENKCQTEDAKNNHPSGTGKENQRGCCEPVLNVSMLLAAPNKLHTSIDVFRIETGSGTECIRIVLCGREPYHEPLLSTKSNRVPNSL